MFYKCLSFSCVMAILNFGTVCASNVPTLDETFSPLALIDNVSSTNSASKNLLNGGRYEKWRLSTTINSSANATSAPTPMAGIKAAKQLDPATMTAKAQLLAKVKASSSNGTKRKVKTARAVPNRSSIGGTSSALRHQ